MSFDHENLQASLTFVDDLSHKVSDFFKCFGMFSHVGAPWVHQGWLYKNHFHIFYPLEIWMSCTFSYFGLDDLCLAS